MDPQGGKMEKKDSNGAPSEPVKDSKIYFAKSLTLQVINWYNVYVQVYVPVVLYIIGGALAAKLAHDLSVQEVDVSAVFRATKENVVSNAAVLTDGLLGIMLLVIIYLYIKSGKNSVYLLDFATFKCPEDWRVTRDDLMTIMERQNLYTQESLDFMRRLLAQSGTSDHTNWPPGTTRCLQEGVQRDISIEMARNEAKIVITGCIDELIRKTGLKMSKVDILVVNCSLFSPTPSLCALISSHYNMRSDLLTYNLSGMGCSAGLISMELAKQLLENNPGKTALVISTENLTQQLYDGNERAFMLQNTLFRCGASAVLLSNKWRDGLRAKYKLLYLVRTQNNKDDAYQAVYETEDSQGFRGVRLSKDIIKVAGRTMTTNLTALGPYVLPLREQAKVAASVVGAMLTKRLRAFLVSRKMDDWATKVPEVQHYVPNFKRGIQHFCIHAGGRAVIDGIEKNLQLSPYDTEPSRATLYNYGNTSSSSIWYELEWLEDHGRIRRGDRTLQLAFGSGFKCNSAVWLRLRK